MNFSKEKQIISARCLWSMESARPEQLPPEDNSWSCYVFVAGRGAGKTRMAAEFIVSEAIFNANTRYAIIAPTMQDVVQTCVEGESGILSILDRYQIKFHFNKSQAKVVLQNGSQIFLYSAEEPNRLRGPQFHGAWLDELAAFANPEKTYDLLLPAMRLGIHPKHIITTTPRPIPFLKEMVRKPAPRRIVVRGTTFDNSKNLPDNFLSDMRNRFEGTRYGRQELLGELLDETEGALFSKEIIDCNRYSLSNPPLKYIRKIVAVDPAVTWTENSNETGIIVVGLLADGHYAVIEDGTLKGPPKVWISKAVELYKKHDCSLIVVEANNGGDTFIDAIEKFDSQVNVKKVTAKNSKESRFTPLSIMYEKGLVHHIGTLFELEDQMTSWVPEMSRNSPDRLDALWWGIYELDQGSSLMRYFAAKSKTCLSCSFPNVKSRRFCSNCNKPI